MKRLLVFLLMAQGAGSQRADMVEPKVEHHKRTTTQEYDDVTVTCPSGYEGHFVDVNDGFGPYMVPLGATFGSPWGEYNTQPYGFTICFSQEFMDKVRKNPELLRQRPAPPRPV